MLLKMIQGSQPLNEKLSDQTKKIVIFFAEVIVGLKKMLSVWVIPRKTRKESNLQDHEDESRKMGHISKLGLMQKHVIVNARMFMFISLSHSNVTFVIPIHVFRRIRKIAKSDY
jgi:hypothetical protein